MFGGTCVSPAKCGIGFGGSSSICSAWSVVRVLFGISVSERFLESKILLTELLDLTPSDAACLKLNSRNSSSKPMLDSQTRQVLYSVFSITHCDCNAILFQLSRLSAV